MELTRISYPALGAEADEPLSKSVVAAVSSFWSRRWSSISIATRVSIILSVAIGVIFAVAAAVSYRDAKDQALAEALGKLDSYNLEVVAEQEQRFQKLAAAHRHATELLRGELAGTGRYSAADIEWLYPRRGDGSRRTGDALYEGSNTPLGYMRGMGGFVGQEPSPTEARVLVAATVLVHAIGEGLRPDLKSMSFFTPKNTLVMFAPDRPDKLLYYRREAPADMSFEGREFLDIVLPRNNPQGHTRCTSLQPILYDKTGRTWTSGCMTPAYVNGRFVGAWGNSILLDDLLAASHFEALPGADVILVSREGRLIRHPLYTKQNAAGTERYLDLTKTKQPELRELWRLLREHSSAEYIGAAPGLGGYVAVRRIPTPGWYAVTIQREAVVVAAANRALVRVAVTALICLCLQAAILFFILHWRVGLPLRRLMSQADQLVHRVAGASRMSLHGNGDEVEQLTSRFEQMGAEVLNAHAVLETRVVDRTRELGALNDELRILTETDPLTGLANRRRAMRELGSLLKQRGGMVSVIMFDVDHFKKINDTQGHPVGDQVLQEIARRAEQLFRPEDIVARIGGEEFLIILPRTRQSFAHRVAERLREAMAAEPAQTAAGKVQFTVSVGFASAARGERDEGLYRRVDEALYEAKRSGRNKTRMAALPPEFLKTQIASA